MPQSAQIVSLPTIVAEVGQAHDGSLGTAHSFIEACAEAGADVIKFQTHLAQAESHPTEPWRVQFSRQDASRFAYWKRMEFTSDQWAGLYAHAHDVGLQFMSSPFSLQAVDLLARTGIDVWKVASGEVTNVELLTRLADDDRPVALSSGMTTWAELDRAVDIISAGAGSLTVLQCTSSYPCPPELTGLNIIGEIKDRYGVPAGISDHSGTIFPSLAAVALGAQMIEVHVTLSRHSFGPDVPASITIPELIQLRKGVDFTATALANPVNKDGLAGDLEEVRQLFTRSVVSLRRISAGETISAQDLTFKKPGTGIPQSRVGEVIGSVAARTIEANAIIAVEDLEPRQ